MEKLIKLSRGRIKDEYLHQIALPETKPAVQYLLCPIGLVGAGKTTVIKPLSEKLSLARISGDEIRKLLYEHKYKYDFNDLISIGNEILDTLLDQGYSVVIDTDCVTDVVRNSLLERVKRFGLSVVWIHINPPEEFIINKLSKLKPNYLGTADEMIENYFRRKPLHENIHLDFTYTFDTSLPDIQGQITESVSVIKNKVGI